jgi:hypothetical protein
MAEADVLPSDDGPVFRVDGTVHTWTQVFALARRRGDVVILQAEVRQALACRARAEAQGRPLERDRERAAAVSFRRARRLHAAEDLEAWLAARGLSVAQWREYVRGEALRRRHAAELDAVVERHGPDDAQVGELLSVWGRCSGAFGRWAEELARLVAVAHALRDRGGSPVPEVTDLGELTSRFDDFAQVVATPDRLESLVTARYLDWLRIDRETASFRNLDTAAEAGLCIRDDGWTLRQAARAGGGRLSRRASLAEEIDDAHRHQFVRAHEDDLLGPLVIDGAPSLVQVLRKHPPTLDDDEVRLRATNHLLDTAVAREVNDRVEWLDPR